MKHSFFSRAPGVAVLLGALATASWAAPLGGAAGGVKGAAHPLVDLESGYLLGGSVGGRWVRPAALARSMKGGEKYRAYESSGPARQARGTRPTSKGAPCEETLFVDMAPRLSAKGFALSAPWDAQPRRARSLRPTQPIYVRAVADLLRQHGIARPQVKIQQLWRVDLEGDGQDEVLISASNYVRFENGSMRSNSRAGDYSVVLLRQARGGVTKTTVLAEEYYPRAKEFNAPNAYSLGAVLDANGDGRMEVIVRSRYYEGDSAAVLEVRGGKATEALNEGCGA